MHPPCRILNNMIIHQKKFVNVIAISISIFGKYVDILPYFVIISEEIRMRYTKD